MLTCHGCGFHGTPNLEETGPHTKAICPQCGKYIKMVGKTELDEIIESMKTPKLLIELNAEEAAGLVNDLLIINETGIIRKMIAESHPNGGKVGKYVRHVAIKAAGFIGKEFLFL